MTIPVVDDALQLQPRCCWCESSFIMDGGFWVCPTPACAARCLTWAWIVNGTRLFVPLPKQAELFEAIESHAYRQILWGGSVGSAKSYGLRHVAYHYCQRFENFSVLLLRRTFPELESSHIFDTVREIARFNACLEAPAAKYSAKKVDFLATKSQLKYGHCQDPDDFKSYLSAQFDLVIFDQLETFLDNQHAEISARVGRIARDGWQGIALSGENPGGPGSAFVDELFISKSRDPKKYPHYHPEEFLFIPARLSDNPYIASGYGSFIGDLPEAKRNMYRFGNRDVFPLQYFKTFTHPARVQRIDVPATVPRLGALHWGYFAPGILLWIVALPDGRLYVEREFSFEEALASTVATDIVSLNRQRGITVTSTWGNSPEDVPEAQHGEDPFESFYRAGFPVYRSKHDPVSGWQRLQHWFAVEEGQVPALIVDPSCTVTIKTIPQLLQAPTNLEDVAPGPSAAAKALRYLVMSRPTRALSQSDQPTRDLSMFDEKTQADIARMQQYERDEKTKDLAWQEAGYPFGDSR